MQKLSERNTCTPTDIPHVRGDCGPSLNSPDGERGGAAALKTFDNNPDAALTAAARAERDLRVPVVYVLNMRGEQSGFWNAREYVLHRDNHACRHCKGKSKDKILNMHHIESRKTGGDRPANLITLCETCHGKYHRGEIDLKVEKSDGFKAVTFMTTVRWKLIDRLREAGDDVGHTYGCFTKRDRIKRGISKSHANDAFVVAGGTGQDRIAVQYRQKQVRKCNRKLFKGVRSHVRNTAPRFVEGFQRFDKVLWNGVECFVFGRRKTGCFDLRKLDDTKIHASAKAKDCVLIESARTLLIERRDAVSSPA